MTIAIIDDDILFSHQLKNEIEKYDLLKEMKIDIYNKNFNDIEINQYDLLFIDMILVETDGLSLAKKITNKLVKIIFISNNESLVYNCFDIHLYFFIRKEFYQDDMKRLNNKFYKDFIETNKQYLVNEKDHIYLKYVNIIYIQSQRNQCTFYTSKQNYQQYITLKKCESIFCQNDAFYKINSYTIINFKYVTKINSKTVTLTNNMIFNISRKCKDIIEKYHTYRRHS